SNPKSRASSSFAESCVNRTHMGCLRECTASRSAPGPVGVEGNGAPTRTTAGGRARRGRRGARTAPGPPPRPRGRRGARLPHAGRGSRESRVVNLPAFQVDKTIIKMVIYFTLGRWAGEGFHSALLEVAAHDFATGSSARAGWPRRGH